MASDNHFDPEIAIQAVRAGDATAVAALVEHYRPYLRLLAALSVGRRLQSKLDESDIVQEASLMVARDLKSFRGHTEPELAAWMRRVLSNVIANTHRHYSRERRNVELEQQLQVELEQSSAGLEKLISDNTSPSGHAVRRERAVILARALEQLPPRYREVLVLRELRDLSLSEIAVQMDGTRNSVQKLWARAIAEIRSILKDTP